jgi:hypothetical protein
MDDRALEKKEERIHFRKSSSSSSKINVRFFGAVKDSLFLRRKPHESVGFGAEKL